MQEIFSHSVNDTIEVGRKLSSALRKGDVVVLSGDLGAGKTALVSGILSYYDKTKEVSSPTFTIVNEHHLKDDLNLYHFDVYRFDFEDEFTAIGGEEFFDKGICVIEWGEKVKNLLPIEYLKIEILKDENNTNNRQIVFKPIGERYKKLIKEVLSL